MKAAYEHVQFGERCSVRVYHRRLPRIPFEWHHHPEYELTLTLNSQGRRHIGDSVAAYGDDDLVLVPPDLPHSWASNRSLDPAAPQVAVVIWFDDGWVRRLADLCPEYADLRSLLRRAVCGLAFEAGAGARMRGALDRLLADDARVRLGAVLEVLSWLAAWPATPLASPSAFATGTARTVVTEPGDGARALNRVLSLIDTRFAEPLPLEVLARAAGLSPRSLSRHFSRHLGESVGQYLARVRIGHACRLLGDTRLPVSVVAARSGFAGIANFNRQFKAMKAMTPAEFRRRFSPATTADAPDQAAEPASPALTERPASLDGPAPATRARRPSF